MTRTSLLSLATAVLLAPAGLAAQRIISDPAPPRSPAWGVGGAQIMQSRAARRPQAAQFDTAGVAPLGAVGDTVTLFYFPDGANLGRTRRARIMRRQRFLPPTAWTRACDNLAHAGWLYDLDAPATSSFAVVVPGAHGAPVFRAPPPMAAAGARPFFLAWADSVWQRYEAKYSPMTDRQRATMYYNFHSDSLDAGWHRTRLWGVNGPDGHRYAVFSVWMRDDQTDGTANTTATWVVNGWGYPVARATGNVDIYGVSDSDGDGIDEVVTSAGLIRWDGNAWRLPEVYRDEPCMLHRVTGPPPGWRP
ncbi:MAG: hypothetical protein KC544_03735 [Gemmatimonadetes bacterium]|nr:hypothetical protein [Gemmatimonadota bacterium]MCA9762223.1 hypothetical protein [Gemmatimonadota bacterium]MCB9518059.1 hypothetical protein [Gemmatimonadales bacterium]HPF62377.1 hypothetical protein [Gemmatimonadales bacterium]HRX19027.1 hypothetical protein [Gemmatimonadales bacterium]